MSRFFWRRPFAWLADSCRFAVALVYWNARKSAYVRRQRSGVCPCQNRSDDCIPRKVRCNAVVGWNDPERFRRVCPLLVSTPQGWRCSVAAAQVRPFWARAWVYGLSSIAAGYVGATLLALIALNGISGARVNWAQVAWPPRWGEIRTAQADRFYDRAMQTFRRGDLSGAYLALSSATQRDPRHYEATLLLAQITMFQGSFLHADGIFGELLRNRPDELPRTAVVYHDTLLSIGRMDRLAEHCVAMATEDQRRAAVWVRSLLLALRSDAPLAMRFGAERAAAIRTLAPHAQLLVRAEIEVQAGRRAEAIEMLQRPFAGPFNPLYMQLQVERLGELGMVPAAQTLLDFYGPIMGEFSQMLAQYSLHWNARETWAARAIFRRLMSSANEASRFERLTAQLISHPDAELFREWSHQLLTGATLPPGLDAAAVWVAGVALGAPREAAPWRQIAQQRNGEMPPDIAHLDFRSRQLGDEHSIVNVINVLTLPRQVIMSLLVRVEATKPPPGRSEG